MGKFSMLLKAISQFHVPCMHTGYRLPQAHLSFVSYRAAKRFYMETVQVQCFPSRGWQVLHQRGVRVNVGFESKVDVK